MSLPDEVVMISSSVIVGNPDCDVAAGCVLLMVTSGGGKGLGAEVPCGVNGGGLTVMLVLVAEVKMLLAPAPETGPRVEGPEWM